MTPDTVKRLILIVLMTIWFVAGLSRYSSFDNLMTIATAVATSLCALLWVVYDAEERTYKPSKFFRLFICLVAIVGVPLYLLRSRAISGLLSIGGLVAFAVVLVTAEAVGTLLVQNGSHLAGR